MSAPQESALPAIFATAGAARRPSPTAAPEKKRFLFALYNLIGQSVDIEVKDGTVYSGIFHTALYPNPAGAAKPGLSVVIQMAKIKKAGSKDVPKLGLRARVVVPAEQLVQLTATEVDFNDGGSARDRTSSGLTTDSAIAGSQQRLVGRQLQKADAWLSKDVPLERLEGSAKGWDQFEANRVKFGVQSTFDESQYTTSLDPKDFSRAQQARAKRLALEIERKTSRNAHVNEERGRATNDGRTEEERYSGVVRRPERVRARVAQSPPSGAPGGDSYVPPFRREDDETAPLRVNAARRTGSRTQETDELRKFAKAHNTGADAGKAESEAGPEEDVSEAAPAATDKPGTTTTSATESGGGSAPASGDTTADKSAEPKKKSKLSAAAAEWVPTSFAPPAAPVAAVPVHMPMAYPRHPMQQPQMMPYYMQARMMVPRGYMMPTMAAQAGNTGAAHMQQQQYYAQMAAQAQAQAQAQQRAMMAQKK